MTEEHRDDEDFPGAAFIRDITLSVPPEECIPIALALILAAHETITGTAGPVYGSMAVGESLVTAVAVLPLPLQHLIAQMAVLAVAMSAEEDAPEDLKTPEGYARRLAEHFAQNPADFNNIRNQFTESMKAAEEIQTLEEAFNAPDAEKPNTEETNA
jgi:hypothetical protein